MIIKRLKENLNNGINFKDVRQLIEVVIPQLAHYIRHPNSKSFVSQLHKTFGSQSASESGFKSQLLGAISKVSNKNVGSQAHVLRLVIQKQFGKADLAQYFKLRQSFLQKHEGRIMGVLDSILLSQQQLICIIKKVLACDNLQSCAFIKTKILEQKHMLRNNEYSASRVFQFVFLSQLEADWRQKVGFGWAILLRGGCKQQAEVSKFESGSQEQSMPQKISCVTVYFNKEQDQTERFCCRQQPGSLQSTERLAQDQYESRLALKYLSTFRQNE